MKISSAHSYLEECKIQASILLKALRSQDLTAAHKAAKRLQRLQELSALSILQIMALPIQRKHVLAVIATEKGFKSWNELKLQTSFITYGFLNQWCATYAEAKEYQKIKGGYLFPYKKQFFICEAEYIKHLGLDPDDSAWRLIDYDWANPKNKAAWQRLNKEWLKIEGTRHA